MKEKLYHAHEIEVTFMGKVIKPFDSEPHERTINGKVEE